MNDLKIFWCSDWSPALPQFNFSLLKYFMNTIVSNHQMRSSIITKLKIWTHVKTMQILNELLFVGIELIPKLLALGEDWDLTSQIRNWQLLSATLYRDY